MSFVQTYIVIVDGTLYASSDGGNTYNEKLSYLGYLAQQGSIALYPQVYVHKFNHNKVFFSNGDNLDAPSKIAISFDQGDTIFTPQGNWTDTAISDSFTASNSTYSSFASVSNSVVYFTGQNYLYKSTDGGESFNYVGSISNILGITPVAGYRGLHFASASVGAWSLDNNVAVTSNGGNSWTLLPTLPVSSGIRDVVIDTTGLIINLVTPNEVYRTVNGGATWTSVFTTTSNLRRFRECLDDPSVLYLSKGSGPDIYKSADFGATWTTITTIAANRDVYFWDDCNSIGIVLSDFAAYVTEDNGSTSTIVQNFNRQSSNTSVKYNCGCPPDSTLVTNESGTQQKCVWGKEQNYESVPVDCCIKLENCITGSIIYTTEELSPDISVYNGQTVSLAEYPGECLLVTVTEETCENTEAVSVTGSFDDCYSCNPVYMLTACFGKEPGKPDLQTLVYTNQSIFEGYLGQIVWLDSASNPKFDTCYTVGVGPYDAATSIVPEPINSFETCNSCGYYLLTNCLDEEDLLYSLDTSLDTFLNKVGKYNDKCYSVSFVQGTVDAVFIDNPFTENPYEDCECCTYIPPEPEFKKYTRVIPEPVREFYRIAQGKCEIDTNIKYGVGWYSEFMRLKQGIHMCVDVDLDKLWMKYKLQEFSMIYDESLCTTATTPDTPADCIEPTGWEPFE